MLTKSSFSFVAIVLLCFGRHTQAFLTSKQKHSSWTRTFSSFSSDGSTDGEKRRRKAEFLNLEPIVDSDTRRQRKDRDNRNRVQFAKFGDDLWTLRSSMKQLSSELVAAISAGQRDIANVLRETLRKIESRDPELVYQIELEAVYEAKRNGEINAAEERKAAALNARSCLPQFNLDGLWVGK